MHRAPHRQHQPDITRGPPLPGRARPWPASPPPATGLGVGLGAASPTALGTGLLAHGSGHCSMPRHGMLGIATAWGCARHGSALGAGVARDCPALGPAPARHTRSRASTGRGWWKARLWAAGISTGTTRCGRVLHGLRTGTIAGTCLPRARCRTLTRTGTLVLVLSHQDCPTGRWTITSTFTMELVTTILGPRPEAAHLLGAGHCIALGLAASPVWGWHCPDVAVESAAAMLASGFLLQCSEASTRSSTTSRRLVKYTGLPVQAPA